MGVSASSMGLSPIDVLEKVVVPQLRKLKQRKVTEEGDPSNDIAYTSFSPSTTVAEICKVNTRRIERSGELAVLRLEPVINAIVELNRTHGQEFADSILSNSAPEVTEEFFNRANEKFSLRSEEL